MRVSRCRAFLVNIVVWSLRSITSCQTYHTPWFIYIINRGVDLTWTGWSMWTAFLSPGAMLSFILGYVPGKLQAGSRRANKSNVLELWALELFRIFVPCLHFPRTNATLLPT
ncbi:uncharacterized protein F4812DRAFT_419244 [Daldinia caldariorum]|uniref:uncharacterized protein n=1 Tax=Daldinia caldariorum TaxID=326644 RepID=UPI002008C30B|nr:uncharacterized protein F4812DRAFT_419244 [Daldinia caldariorum]KAI1470855.1 hypothetical protein F4812DRAFT_419244 [Daldinia caldariorum]